MREELKPDGANILVTDIDEYISRRIANMLKRNRIFMNQMRNGLFQVNNNFNYLGNTRRLLRSI